MSTPYRIVIGFDFSDLARAAFAEAVALGRGQKEPELHLVTVVDSDASELIPTEDRHQSLVQITDHVRERLIAEAGRLLPGEGGPLRTIGHVRVGSIADEIVSLATEVRADLLVLGTHGRRGVRRLIMGSVAERSARMAPCPVLIVRPRDYHAMDGLPELEPACPACLKAREESQGAQWWCEEHVSRPEAPHRYGSSMRLDQPPQSCI